MSKWLTSEPGGEFISSVLLILSSETPTEDQTLKGVVRAWVFSRTYFSLALIQGPLCKSKMPCLFKAKISLSNVSMYRNLTHHLAKWLFLTTFAL